MIGIVAAVVVAAVEPASRQYEIGMLECVMRPGEKLGVVGTKHLWCSMHLGPGQSEPYEGELDVYSGDDEQGDSGPLAWSVTSPHRIIGGNAAGTYVTLGKDSSMLGGPEGKVRLRPLTFAIRSGDHLPASLELRAR